jgi:hypothetical protein
MKNNAKILIKCIEVENIKNFPKIELKSIEEFLDVVNVLGKPFVCKYKDDFEDIFFIVDGGAMYYIPSEGFKTIDDLYDAKTLGMNAEEYYEYINFNDIEEYKKHKSSGFLSIEDYKKAKECGFIGGLEKLVKEGIATKKDGKYMINYYSPSTIGEVSLSNDAELYYFAMEKGFKDFNELLNVLKLGFIDISEYRDAIKRGFSDPHEYNDALSKGFKDAEEYYLAKDIGIKSKEEFEEYKKLKEICKAFNLETFEEGYLINILINMELGSEITLNDLYRKLKEKVGLMKLKKDMLSKLYSSSSTSWYSTKFSKIEELDEYLSKSEIVGYLGEYSKKEKIFRRVYPSEPSKRFVIIDGISVLNSADTPSAKYIEELIKKVKDAGFKHIIIIDVETYKKSKDKEVYEKLSKECDIKKEDSMEEAYKLIAAYIKTFGALVISNATFKDYLIKDSVGYKTINNYIIPFVIKGGDVNVDVELLRKIFTELVANRIERIKRNVIL